LSSALNFSVYHGERHQAGKLSRKPLNG
jgi:hypothetical protein